MTEYDPSLLTSNLFTDITRDSRGYLWVGTEYGLNKFDGIHFTAYYGDYGREGDLHTSRIIRLYADTCADAPVLWVLFYGALQYYDAETDRFEYVDLSLLPEPALTAIFRHDDELLLHSKESGFWRIECVNGKPAAVALSSYDDESAVGRYSTSAQWWNEAEQSVTYRDSDGTVWRGTRRKSLTCLSPYEQGTTYIPLNEAWSDGEPVYSCFAAPDGHLYVGQIANGLRRIDRDGRQVGTTLLPGLTCSCRLVLSDGSVLIGTTTEGLYQYDSPVATTPAHHFMHGKMVKSLVEADDGRVYVGVMEGGVVLLNTRSGEVEEVEGYYPTNIYVNKLAMDTAGILWIGHYSGIDCYDTRHHCMIEVEDERLLTAAVYDILPNGTETYLATNKGLFVVGTELHRYTMEDGLPSNVICRMLRDEDGAVWMSTFHGISMFVPAEQPVFINYHLGNGMQAVRHVRGAGDDMPTGELLLADDNGIMLLTPRLLSGRPFNRPIVLSNLYMSGVRVTPETRSHNKHVVHGAVDSTNELWFSYLDNVITMQFSPMDMRDNRNVCYQYRFTDDDHTVWHTTLPGESSVTFSRLGYGRHVLLVRARDGICYSATSQWIIHVIPPFYLRWWAILIYIILISTTITIAVYNYHRGQERKLLREQLQFYLNRSHELPVTLTVEMKGNDKQLMERMMDFVNAHFDDSDLSVEMIADGIGISRAQLQRRVKDITGTSVGSLVREMRLKQAAELLRQGDINVSQVGYTVGFNAPNVFSTAFKKYYGVSPKEYAIRNRTNNQPQ